MDVLAQTIAKQYAIYNGDSCELIKNIRITVFITQYFPHHSQVFIHTLIATEIWEIAEEIMNFMSISSFWHRNFTE